MEINPDFLDFIKRFEAAKFSPNAYYDNLGKKWTIGYGTTVYADGSPVKQGDTITEKDAFNAIGTYLQTRIDNIKQYFPNWERFPEQMKYGLLNMAYRGGADNFGKKSPKFTKALNDAMEDGILSTEEYQKILNEMGIDQETSVNLKDRKQRMAALLGGMYDFVDNESINSLGGAKNTVTKTPYTNFNHNIFYRGNNWNTKWNLFQNANKSNANFVERLKQSDRETLDLGNGMIGTHKMAYSTADGYDIVYPEIQTQYTYPWWDFLKLKTPKAKLVDLSSTPKVALESAIQNGDTIHVPSGYGEYFTTTYKQHYPSFHFGGTLNYLNCFDYVRSRN